MSEKWIGVITGTNRGLVVLDIDFSGDSINGQITLFDVNGQNLKASLNGGVQGNVVSATLTGFQPSGDGFPTSGKLEGTLSADRKEISGKWETNIGTSGEATLYGFASSTVQNVLTDPKLTLERRELPVRFCTLDSKAVREIFTTLDQVCKSIRQGRENEVFPPVYSITYDAGESARTYVLEEIFEKFKGARRVSHLGVEFNDKQKIQELRVDLSYQPNMGFVAVNSASFQSTDRGTAVMVAEMIRGMLSKARNSYWWFHGRWFEAVVQFLAVASMFWLSYLVARKIGSVTGAAEVSTYGFIATLIILSNLWTYLSGSLFSLLHKYYPVVEIVNRPKSRVLPNIAVGVVTTAVATALFKSLQLLWQFLAKS